MIKNFMTAALVVVMLALAPDAWAEFYRYVREDGQTVFVDDLGKVPAKYRDQVKRYEESAGGGNGAPKESVPEAPAEPSAAGETPPGEKKKEALTRVLIKKNRVYVPVILGYGILEVEALMVLDTGASVTTLYRDVVDRLFMRGADRAFGRTADGNLIPVELATLDYLQVGPHRRENLRVGIVDLEGENRGYDGLLGMDFLRGLHIHIDYERKAIVWK